MQRQLTTKISGLPPRCVIFPQPHALPSLFLTPPGPAVPAPGAAQPRARRTDPRPPPDRAWGRRAPAAQPADWSVPGRAPRPLASRAVSPAPREGAVRRAPRNGSAPGGGGGPRGGGGGSGGCRNRAGQPRSRPAPRVLPGTPNSSRSTAVRRAASRKVMFFRSLCPPVCPSARFPAVALPQSSGLQNKTTNSGLQRRDLFGCH